MKPLSLSQPHLLIMVGIPGSGKSFFAEKFSETFHTPYVSFQEIMEISNQNSDLSAGYMTHLLRELFKTNHTIIVDGLADSKSQRDELRNFAHAAGYKPFFIWVQTDTATAKTRAIKASKSYGYRLTSQQYDQALSHFITPDNKEGPVVVISGKHTYATQARAVLKQVAAAKQITRSVTPHERHAPPIPPVSSTSVTNNKRNITIN